MIGSKIRLWKSVLLLIAIAVVTFAFFLYSGKAGDCKPHQIDGQCGLSTFLGFIYGTLSAAVILICGGIYLTIAKVRENAKIKAQRDVLPN
jgi:uncharacterized membrane protein